MVFFTNISQVFGIILLYLSNDSFKSFQMESLSKEYPVNPGVPKGSTLGPALSLLSMLVILGRI